MQPIAIALDVQSLARFLKALSDETRVRIVALLALGELCVCHLEAAIDVPQSTVSRHLAVLRNAGIVEHRRQGTWVYYRLVKQNDSDCDRQLRGLIESFASRKDLRPDVERLLKAKGPGSCR